LDEKTELIDKLISTKEQKISLLKEQRTSLINQVVTKGLNPNVKMKDSGVEWIGEIPLHWMISKFKFDSSSPVQYGLNISGDKYQEEGIRFIRITDLTEEGELIKEDGKYLDENEVPSEFLLNKWDVLFCRSGHTVGKSYLHKEDGKFTSGGYLVRFNFRNYFESKFIFYIGKTSFYWDWIKLNSVVSTIENVNGDKYQNFQYPKPPIQEQQSIVEFLDKRTKEIDDLVSLEQKKIDLLKEYRQSLISEVVTGKVKVTQ
jgi:type I restriction enzyme S subunit